MITITKNGQETTYVRVFGGFAWPGKAPGMAVVVGEEIKKINADIPVLMCTGHDLSEDPEQLKSSGANDFITKPYNPASMEEKLKPFL